MWVVENLHRKGCIRLTGTEGNLTTLKRVPASSNKVLVSKTLSIEAEGIRIIWKRLVRCKPLNSVLFLTRPNSKAPNLDKHSQTRAESFDLSQNPHQAISYVSVLMPTKKRHAGGGLGGKAAVDAAAEEAIVEAVETGMVLVVTEAEQAAEMAEAEVADEKAVPVVKGRWWQRKDMGAGGQGRDMGG